MEKIIKDGNVAVAISPAYGGGWSSEQKVDPMDAEFNRLFLYGRYDEAAALARDRGLCDYGITSVKIVWLPVGTEFQIDNYDGAESLIRKDEQVWHKA